MTTRCAARRRQLTRGRDPAPAAAAYFSRTRAAVKRDLTSLELATRIARAVLTHAGLHPRAIARHLRGPLGARATAPVLAVLRDEACWFCRVYTNRRGVSQQRRLRTSPRPGRP